jgi:hypothetical protein
VPSANHHQSLLDWLNGPHGTNATDLFGRVHGAVTAVDDLRNGILVLLYAVPEQTLAALVPDDIVRTVNVLRNNAHLSSRQKILLQNLMGASADVFHRFVSPVEQQESSPKPSRPRPRM